MDTTLQTLDFCTLWEQALPFTQFVDEASVNQELWRGIHRQARLPEWAIAEATRQAPRRWLVLAEDWCNDAVSVVPVLARLADEVDGIDLRILRRDEHPAVMDEYLSEGGARAIPIVIVLDELCEELGHWGSRPSVLQQWVLANRDLEKPARNLEIRKWYARDRGETTLREVLAVGSKR
ncbi:MAG: thioredoxin family protein [Gemmatimonadales bacterium]